MQFRVTGIAGTHGPRAAWICVVGATMLVAAWSGGVAVASVTPPSAQPRGAATNRVCPTSDRARLRILETGTTASVWADGTFGVVVPVTNTTEGVARRVVVTRVKVSRATLLGAKALPVRLGDITGETVRQLPLHVKSRGALRRRYGLVVVGRYGKPGAGCRFVLRGVVAPVRRNDKQTFKGRRGQARVQQPKEAKYPKPRKTEAHEFNAETPMLIPPGPRRLRFPPTPTPSRGETLGGAALVDVDRNLNSTSSNAGFPPDPNAARGGQGVVISTFNTGISYSTNGGQAFTDVNLFAAPDSLNPARTSFFPQSDGGLCCDQVVTYVPDQNLFVWLSQYNPVTTATPGPGGTTITRITQASRLRVAWATPSAIAADFANAWSYVDLTAASVPGVSSGLGAATNEWLDYPDLAFSRSRLYVGVDHGAADSFGSVYTGRRIVARLNLAQMADPNAAVVNYDFAEYSGSAGLNKSHFVQGAGERMVLASLDDTSTLRVFTWRDTAGSASVSTTGISSITRNYTSVAPDRTDWYAVGFPGNITGATSLRGQYVFAFDAGVSAPGRPRAYVRLETVTPSANGANATAEYDVWHPDYAYGMAALGTQTDGLGMGLAVGGGTIGYPQFAVGYKDDFVVYTVTGSNATQTAPGVSRFGDYFSVRPIPGDNGFAAETYDVLQSTPGQTCLVGGCRAIARYVEFRRAPPG